MRNFRMLLTNVPMTTYNKINWKRRPILIIHFYKLVWFHKKRCFRASLSIRLSDSGQPIKCARKYCTNKPCHKLHHYIPAHSTCHYTLLHNLTIIHAKRFLVPACHLHKKISSDTKLSHFPLLHPQTIHTSSYTSKYDSK